MSPPKSNDIAIVGAGMVGAALALALAKAGFDVAVIEPRAPTPWNAQDDVDLRVVALAPSSIELLGRLEVWKSIRDARVCAYRAMRVWDSLAPGELNFDAADEGRPALGYIVENRLIQSVLWNALGHELGITLHCQSKIAATEAAPERRTLRFDDGTTIAAKLVVAADGTDSALRGMAGIGTRDRDYGQRAIVAHVTTERAHESTAWQRFLSGATLAFLPLADGRSSIVWSVPEAESRRLLALDDAAFCAELGAAFDFRLGRVTATTRRASFPLRMKLADRYLAPRLVLIGDAAHAVHPLAGQGVNLGLRDVDELGAVLIEARDAKRDFAAESVLRRYERRRRSDNVMSAHAFDAIQRVFGSEAMPIAALRGAGLALVNKIEPLKRVFARHAEGR
ncbi:MAG: UbiH/UbiF/VisC/COQ6 family ubiquinone biosynthesis hydroxylase [Xanthomonadaceae bacterium]|nr:UbiH/UbiF/VisC/COQ6 family ubiquinone biosynthesis hydroxylase [Xanthomonadaceae bacterium]MDE1960194.1 UbiH/UbiF/VisC/COQ6 family ubiquinone biosynthesis hydroxylase [Xanthomonadaceae bacterium]MDE2084572.1 UbiH/UbiF/VisC/COQ6 family ubiquinone biosynthesis hydroxylase [Xanthomonadaceae bacterium]